MNEEICTSSGVSRYDVILSFTAKPGRYIRFWTVNKDSHRLTLINQRSIYLLYRTI